ncbi:hypothetical protein ABPG72_014544 [Tetrahymena utriculariae]
MSTISKQKVRKILTISVIILTIVQFQQFILDYSPKYHSFLDILKANINDENQFFQDSRKILCILGQYENRNLMKQLFQIEQQSSIDYSHKIERFANYFSIFQIISIKQNINLKTSVLAHESKVSNFELEFEKNKYFAKQIQKQQNIFKLTQEYQLETCDSLIYITNDYQIESKQKIESIIQNNKSNKNILIVHDLVFFDEEYQKVYQNILKQSKNLKIFQDSLLNISTEYDKQKNIFHIFIPDQLASKDQYSSSIIKFIYQQNQYFQKKTQEELLSASIDFVQRIQQSQEESNQFQYQDQTNKCNISHGLNKKTTTIVECSFDNEQILENYLKEKKNLKQYLVIQLKKEISYENAEFKRNEQVRQLQIFQTFKFQDVDHIITKYPNQTHYESLFVGLIGSKHYDIYKSQEFSLLVKVPDLPFDNELQQKKILQIQDEVIASNSDILMLYITNFDLEQLMFIYDFCRFENLKFIMIYHDLTNLIEEQAILYKQMLIQNYNLAYTQFKKEFYWYRQQKDYCYNKNLKQIQHYIFTKDNKVYKQEFHEYLNKLIQQATKENFYKKRSTNFLTTTLQKKKEIVVKGNLPSNNEAPEIIYSRQNVQNEINNSNLNIDQQTNLSITKDWETYKIFSNSTFDQIGIENQSFERKIGLISQFSFNKKIILKEVFGYKINQSNQYNPDHLQIFKNKDYLILEQQEANQISINIAQQQQLELFINSFIQKSSDLLILIVNNFQPSAQLYLQKMYENIDQDASIITLHYIAQLEEQKDITEYESQILQTNYLRKEKFKGITFYSQHYNSYDLLKIKRQIIHHIILPNEFNVDFSRYVEGLKIIIDSLQQSRHQKKQVNFQKFTETLNQQFKE